MEGIDFSKILTITLGIIIAIIAAVILLLIATGGMTAKEDLLEKSWTRKKRKTLFALPWGYTFYRCENGRLYITSGFFNKHEEQINLYRIRDIDFSASLFQRMFNLGTISLISSDKTAGNIKLVNIKDAKTIKERLSNDVEEERDKKRVGVRELVENEDDDMDN